MTVIMIFSVISECAVLISWGSSTDSYDGSSGFLGFLSLFLPFVFTFYFVGWKHYQKKIVISSEVKDSNFNKSSTYLDENKNSVFCSKCGKKNNFDSKYCIECGQRLIN